MTATVVPRSLLLLRLKRIEGQVRGIARMVNGDRDCIDILTQFSAADQALRSVAVALLDELVAQCLVAAADASESHKDAKLREAHDAIARLVGWSDIDRPAMEGKRRDLHATNRPVMRTHV